MNRILTIGYGYGNAGLRAFLAYSARYAEFNRERCNRRRRTCRSSQPFRRRGAELRTTPKR
jgi:hypothetical protein